MQDLRFPLLLRNVENLLQGKVRLLLPWPRW